ncbi:hypothetical protein HBHAL_3526 [Halobacillus halophilus DSM 2266]|uniref:Uncharacterized protein n=1 Tax=Halobacillus halophilus (strain ATCC 35676 / DSM 2266 / JCM 20832 / KCTC 3685 / LMG 17431 / NBRC 102448 / NCIMB 2269) TaxID=866895 RepID=I0JP01_HALH3|nr:hypothetical protein HBHAL_3526 [Halobacillus halophilus DSM 2266]
MEKGAPGDGSASSSPRHSRHKQEIQAERMNRIPFELAVVFAVPFRPFEIVRVLEISYKKILSKEVGLVRSA